MLYDIFDSISLISQLPVIIKTIGLYGSAFMKEPVVLMADDPILNSLKFRPYRNVTLRRAVPFMPEDGQPQTMEVVTPWGSKLMVTKGDFLISELDKPEDVWPIDARIFDDTYLVTAPGLCIKRSLTLLVPLTAVTDDDEDQIVIVHTLEGPETVRAGDFFLAKGVKGEIWPYPKAKAAEMMKPAS
jgi:hypothetical protein